MHSNFKRLMGSCSVLEATQAQASIQTPCVLTGVDVTGLEDNGACVSLTSVALGKANQ